MIEQHEVISRFLDNEEFDALELGTALADPDGRELLIDLIALRHLVQEAPANAIPVPAPARSSRIVLRPLLAAAAVLVALVGGYQLGTARATEPEAPPVPTVVVPATGQWQVVSE